MGENAQTQALTTLPPMKEQPLSFEQQAVWDPELHGAAERTPLFEKRINSKPKKIRQIFFYFWKTIECCFISM